MLWRAQNLNISDNIDCIVLCCGTNNLNKNSPIEIVNGIVAIGNYFFGNNPNISIIIFGLLPRDLATSSNRSTIEYVNYHLKNICDSKKCFSFIDPGKNWTEPNDDLKMDLFFRDNIHLIEKLSFDH